MTKPIEPATTRKVNSPESRSTLRLRVCILTTASVNDNPRVVKEADALAAAGHHVRVIAFRPRTVEGQERDRNVVEGKLWRLDAVQAGRDGVASSIRWLTHSVLQRAARFFIRHGLRHSSIVDAAISRNRATLVSRAVAEPADLIIAHHAAALPAAARAARRIGACLAFDAEDLHSEELPETPENALDRSIIAATEARYLPRCHRVTASSQGIGIELSKRYGIPQPQTILNAFPIEADLPARRRGRADAPISLYWFSQVVGLDRGLQDVIRAMPLVQRRVELHLRGLVRDDVRASLLTLASQLGVGDSVHFHPVAPPPQLPALASQYDIGLALEQPVTLNRRLCVTNKLLLYFTAGIPVVATDTPGQRAIIEAAGGAGVLYPPGDAEALASAIDTLTETPARLEEARRKARELGRGALSWEAQAPALLAYLTGTDARPSCAPSTARPGA